MFIENKKNLKDLEVIWGSLFESWRRFFRSNLEFFGKVTKFKDKARALNLLEMEKFSPKSALFSPNLGRNILPFEEENGND